MAYKESIHTKKWDRCVKKVSRKDIAVNPYAVCTARLEKKAFKKSHRRK